MRAYDCYLDLRRERTQCGRCSGVHLRIKHLTHWFTLNCSRGWSVYLSDISTRATRPINFSASCTNKPWNGCIDLIIPMVLESAVIFQGSSEIRVTQDIVKRVISVCEPSFQVLLHRFQWSKTNDDTTLIIISRRRRRPGDGRYCNTPRLSVTFSFRTVTQKRIAVFSQNFASTCTKSWRCAV